MRYEKSLWDKEKMGKLKLDHIVLVVPDLKKAIAFFKDSLGIEPMVGGKHRGVGTHNALLRLGPAEELTYLELFAIDLEDKTPYESYPMGISRDTPNMYIGSWCIRCTPETDIIQMNQSIKALGKEYDLGDVRKMQRVTPSHSILSWQLASTSEQVILSHGQIPFLIKWDNLDLHPAINLPENHSTTTYNLSVFGPTSKRIEENLLRLGFASSNHITFNDSADISISLLLRGKESTIAFKGKGFN